MRWLDRFGKAVDFFRGWSAAKQDIAIITIVYFLSQGAILFLTGKWIDDWCPFWEEETLREMVYMAGSGEPAIWIKRLGYALPGNGYLFLTFFFFYMASLSLQSGELPFGPFSRKHTTSRVLCKATIIWSRF